MLFKYIISYIFEFIRILIYSVVCRNTVNSWYIFVHMLWLLWWLMIYVYLLIVIDFMTWPIIYGFILVLISLIWNLIFKWIFYLFKNSIFLKVGILNPKLDGNEIKANMKNFCKGWNLFESEFDIKSHVQFWINSKYLNE